MEEVVLPMSYKEYSALPHQDTYKVEDELSMVWDEVVSVFCDKWKLNFHQRFLRNPLHFSYKFISQMCYLLQVVLPLTGQLSESVGSLKSIPLEDMEKCKNFLSLLPNSTLLLKSKADKRLISEEDIVIVKELCDEVEKTLNLALFQQFDCLQNEMRNFLRALVLLMTTLQANQPSQSSNKLIHKYKKYDNFIVPGDEVIVDGVVLCLPCKTNIDSTTSSYISASYKKKRKVFAYDDDEFLRPVKHVNFGYCPCCD